MAFQRGNSTLGTVLGVLVMIVAIVGNVFLDWTWNDPDMLPLIIGVVAAVGGGLVVIQRIQS